MKNQSNKPSANFWFGFMAGGGGALILMYLFGTKQGRDTMKKCIRFSENMEENIIKVIDGVEKHSKKGGKKETSLSLESIGEVLQKIKRVTT